jgi:hypothetical protein
MTNKHFIATSLVIVAVLIAIVSSGFSAGRVEAQPFHVMNPLALYPNIETMGVAAYELNLPDTAQLLYRQQGETYWRTGHPLIRIDDGRLVGSLFGLSPSTTYEVRVFAGPVEFGGTATTQPEELQFTPAAVLHVDDNASVGGDGSAAAPLRTIQEAVHRAGAGTQVLVADGVYREAVTFPASGNANQWIQVKAAGAGAILDGSKELNGNVWRTHPTRGRVWFTDASLFGYLARDQMRFYHYENLSGLMQSRGWGGVTVNEGWYFDSSTSRLYIRSQDDPSDHRWRMSQLAHAFDVNGRDWIWIEGFEMQFYGRCGVCTVNASHLVIRGNKIHNMLLGIFVDWNGGEHQGNDTRIEYNEVYDPLVNEFPWNATKASTMEGTALIVRGHIGAIVRGNDIHNFFNGIYTGSSGALQNPGVAFDADIYNNYIHDISDDALEPEGAAVNHRFRNNIIEASFVGVSLAPVTQGPTWVLRNVVSNYTSRSLKWALNSDGSVFIYHNTSWTNASSVNAMDLITPVRNSVMRNNIFQSTGYAFAESPTGSTANDWDYDNWYTTRGSSLPHFKWENRGYNTVAQLCAATGLECNGYEDVPGFANPQGGNFTLLSSSPNIDRGAVIPGINDVFTGNAPDVGAYESVFNPPPRVVSVVPAANPASVSSVNFTVTFSGSVSGVDLLLPYGDFKPVYSPEIQGALITGVTRVSEAAYIVRMEVGAGSGTIRMDVIDDDSIVDSQGQPLGGAGTGNGDFTTGEEYVINRPSKATTSIAFKSTGGYDGWILESGENTNAGGRFDRNATTFIVGDDPKDRQYKSILSFDTSSLPDNAVIVSAQLKAKRQGVVGTDPFQTHGTLLAEARKGPFSNHIALQTADFSAVASPGAPRDPFSALTSSWYVVQFSDTNLLLVNKAGVTQFRLFFNKDDNDDRGSDYMKFFSGNSTDANKPELIVTYYVP